MKVFNGKLGKLEGSYRRYLLNSYCLNSDYFANDIEEWSQKIHRLNTGTGGAEVRLAANILKRI